MNQLTAQQRSFYECLLANRARGMAIARSTRLPSQMSRVVNNLRRLGLVEPETYRPIALPAPIAAVEARKAPVEGKAAQPKGLWPADRCERFLGELARTGEVNAAVRALGLTGKAGLYGMRKASPAFAARWDAALARFAAGEVADTASRPFASSDGLAEARRPSDAGSAGNDGADPLPEQDREGAAAGEEPELAVVEAGAERLGHRELGAGAELELKPETVADRIRRLGKEMSGGAPAMPASARLSLGIATPTTPVRRVSYIEGYIQRLEKAKAYLRGLSCSVVQASRDAVIPSWHVSGYTGAFSNEQLIQLAISRGMEPLAA
jgi:hypothetical protein